MIITVKCMEIHISDMLGGFAGNDIMEQITSSNSYATNVRTCTWVHPSRQTTQHTTKTQQTNTNLEVNKALWLGKQQD